MDGLRPTPVSSSPAQGTPGGPCSDSQRPKVALLSDCNPDPREARARAQGHYHFLPHPLPVCSQGPAHIYAHVLAQLCEPQHGRPGSNQHAHVHTCKYHTHTNTHSISRLLDNV